jgi:DNA/RNA-binding domain of Phe-tRNA-synthetase-like protein
LTSQPRPQESLLTNAVLPADQRPWLAAASVDAAVYDLRPDYRVMLMTADGLGGGPSDTASEQILSAAERAARQLTSGRPLDELPHLASWREAYRAFGARPQRTRPSVEALLRRLDAGGLPRIDRITDVYNAISISHVMPVGGEDRAAYAGPPHLVRADGSEFFDTTANGAAAVERPSPGEVIWRDDAGVTCRRWNWRQCTRTRITAGTSSAVFILDVLDPVSPDELDSAADALEVALRALSPAAAIERRLIP